MTADINLAGSIVAKIRQKQKLKRLLNKGIIWAGLIISLALIIVSGVSLLVNQQNQKLEKQIKSTQTKIESLSKVESQQVYLTNKLGSFSGLLKTHELHQSVAETIFALIPSGTSIKGFAVNESGIISLSGSSPSWQLFSRLLVNLNQAETEPLLLKEVKVNQVNFNSEGSVNFDLQLTISV